MQRGFVILAVLCAAPSAVASESGGTRARSSVQRLLTLAAEPSAKNLLAARQFYRCLPREVGQARDVQYAFLLALIGQRKFHEASELANEVAKGQTPDLALIRTQVWLDLTVGKRETAMNHLNRLAGRLAGSRGLTELELAEFFGAACGFLSGPCSRYIRAADVQSLADRLRASLSDGGRVQFDRARKELLECYNQLRGQYDQRTQKELASRSLQLDAAKESVDRAAKEIDAKQQALKDKHDRRVTEATAKRDDVDKQIKEIEQKRQALVKRIATLEVEQLALTAQLLPEPVVPAPKSNPAVLRAVIAHNYPIRQLLAQVVAKLIPLVADEAALRQKETELLLQRAATDAKYGAELGKIEQQDKSLDKDGKRIAYRAKRIKAKPVAIGPRLNTESRQLTRFSTYMPFPFERERRRLLPHDQ